MAPRFVLLERQVPFEIGEPTGGDDDDAREKGADILKRETTEAAVQAMKPERSIFEPPEVSRLTMVRQMGGVVLVPDGDGEISSTDKALVVMYAGRYRTSSSYIPSSGCYLVYDASTNSVSAVPQIPSRPYFDNLGRGIAILSRGGGGGEYLLAEIGTGDFHGGGVLYLWQGRTSPPGQGESSRRRGQWDRKSVKLPPQVTEDYVRFFIDVTFSYADSSSICWVDLLHGIVVCDLLKATEEDGEPELTFVPLPQGYSMDLSRKPRPRPEQFRTMSCVNGVIKFVALVENNFAIDDLMLRSWTLSPDLKEWTECNPPLAVQDFWESKSFRNNQLPKNLPIFPVLSIDEDEVVYLSLQEIERKESYDIYGQFDGVDIVTKAHHVLRFDMTQNKVLDCTKITQGTLVTSHWPTLIATDFTS